MTTDTLLLGKAEAPVTLALRYANRHGLVAGATGTGKTVTLQTMAEGFSRAGVPVFCADVKGDLSGIGAPGAANPRIEARAGELGLVDFAYEAAPVIFWDLDGVRGHPLRATVAEMGPLLLARMLELNDTQEGVLNIAFKVADDEGLLILDFKDLVAVLQSLAERAGELTTDYGNVGKATIGTIQRRLLTLEQQGGEKLFGEPALELADLMLVTPDGRGAVNVLVADTLMQSPRVYATFLLWLLSELFEELPEVGDLDKPKLVFFFDEAHLLFTDAPKSLVQKVEQVVRLIRSKGVGVYFVTQNPQDVPGPVLSQLGNRVQHALRAFTPAEQKAVRAAAETFRPNPSFATGKAVMELGVGEALVSTLEAKGTPSMVERTRIAPPRSRLGPLAAEELAQVVAGSPLGGKYDAGVDRESAYELLRQRATTVASDAGPAPPWGTQPVPTRGGGSPWGAPAPRQQDGPLPRATAPRSRRVPAEPPASGGMLQDIVFGGGRRQGLAETVAKQMARSVTSQVGNQVGRAIVRGILGSILKR